MTYTYSKLLFCAEEGVGYATDFPINMKVFCLTLPEHFVHVELEDEMDEATSVKRLQEEDSLLVKHCRTTFQTLVAVEFVGP